MLTKALRTLCVIATLLASTGRVPEWVIPPQDMSRFESYGAINSYSFVQPVSWVDSSTIPDLTPLAVYAETLRSGQIRRHISFAPLDVYKQTVQHNMDNSILLFSALLGNGSRVITPVQNGTLPNGVQIKWQMITAWNGKIFWYEAFSDYIGFNVVIFAPPDVDDDILINTARTLQLSEESQLQYVEEFYIPPYTALYSEPEIFRTSDQKLTVTLDTAFSSSPNTDPSALLNVYGRGQDIWFLMQREENLYDLGKSHRLLLNYWETVPLFQDVLWGEAQVFGLEALGGAEIYVSEFDIPEINPSIPGKAFAFTFIYDDTCYYGLIVWPKMGTTVYRDYMLEALLSIAPVE